MFGKIKNKPPSGDALASPSGIFESQDSPGNARRTTPLLDRFVERNVAPDQKSAIVSDGFVVRGEIDGTGTLHIEGVVIGSVATNTAHISPTGAIEGTLVSSIANIKGRFDGDLSCDELVVFSTAHLKGRFTYRQLSVQPGAVLDGELIMVPADASTT